MATLTLAESKPRPFAVLTEEWYHKLGIPDEESGEYSFGKIYEENLYKLINKYLELNTYDKLAYVGGLSASNVADIHKLKKHFELENPVCVDPGHIHYEETPNSRMFPVKLPNIGAEDYFRELGRDWPEKNHQPAPFDKILLREAVEHLAEPREAFSNIMKCVAKNGRLLIIHRPGPMNTLPYFSEATKRLNEVDIAGSEPYIDIIRNLQSLKLDVKWEIEIVPIVMPKVKWLKMLENKFPSQLKAVSDVQVAKGVRELMEGMLKYSGEMVEFFDRLLFVTASHPLQDCGYPSIQRAGKGSYMAPDPNNLSINYKLEITPDIYGYVKDKVAQGFTQEESSEIPYQWL